MKTINQFIAYLQKFNRQSCPEDLYIAWKILVLKTTEYRDSSTEFDHLYYAYKRFREDCQIIDN